MSNKLPKAVRLALIHDGIAEGKLDFVDDEMTYEYEQAITGLSS
jgi:hypothetical protein